MIKLGVTLQENPIRIMLYDTINGSLQEKHIKEIDLSGESSFVINFCESDERLFAQKDIPTISMEVFLSMCGGYAMKINDVNDIFMHNVGIHYINAFCNKRVNFSALYSFAGFWGRITRLVNAGMEMIREQGLQHILKLEARTTIALHHMCSGGYLFDVERVRREYLKLYAVLADTKNCIRNGDGDLAELQSRCRKLENKIQRIPMQLYCSKKKRVVLTCHVRSAGTDTHRIITTHANIQGLPKSIRNCLLPRHGGRIVEVDLKNSQLILLACISSEKSLIKSYLKGMDLYLQIASELTGKEVEEISSVERNAYKTMILQIIYSAGASTIHKGMLSKGIEASIMNIRYMYEHFFHLFPKIKEFLDKIKAEKVYYIELPTGRKWDMTFIQPYKRLAYILQYEESIILREILVMLDEESREKCFWLYLCIFDSIVIESREEMLDKMLDIIRKVVNKAVCKYLPEIKKVNIKEKFLC